MCADYIIACYASRENWKARGLQSAGEALHLGARGRPASGADMRVMRPTQDPLFQERFRIFYDELMAEFHCRNRAAEATEAIPSTASSSGGLDDRVVREVMKPRLLQIVEKMCRERDRQFFLNSGAVSSTKSPAASTTATNTGAGGDTEGELLPPTTGEIRIEGWLRKKGQHVDLWRERYFMIRSTPDGTHFLCYLRKKGDKEPRAFAPPSSKAIKW